MLQILSGNWKTFKSCFPQWAKIKKIYGSIVNFSEKQKIFFYSLIVLPFILFIIIFFFATQYDQNDRLGLKSQTV